MQSKEPSPLRAPTGLTCELLSHPENTVITNARPRFGWVVNDGRRGAVQSAYRIVVASSKDALARDSGDIWDSGQVKSSESVNVAYGGRPLPADSPHWWAVQTWDKDGHVSPWSAAQKISTGKPAPDEPFYADRWIDSTANGSPSSARVNCHPLEVHRVAPVEVIAKGSGHYLADFGRAAFGTLSVTMTCEVDAHEIEIRLGEMRGADDTVEINPGGSVVHLSQRLPLKRGTHTYALDLPLYQYGMRMPRNTGEVAPFRYCEIIDSPCEIGKKDLAQLAVFYHFDDSASSFASSDPALNDVWKLCKYSIKATSFLGVYVDGQRERLPYEADAYINQLGHYCVDREYAMARCTHEHLIDHPTWPTEWILFSVLIAWADYMYTGNDESIRRRYDDLKAKTLLPLAREDGLISTRTGLMTHDLLQSVHFKGKELRDIVDWPQPSESDGHVFAAINTVVNAFHYRALVLMGRLAEAIGRGDDALMYQKRAKNVCAAFNEKLFDSARGVYRDGEGAGHASLHSNMFALAFGLVEEKRKHSVVEFIKSRGMACSVYGAQFLLEALYSVGEDRAALDLMTNEGDRSWPHMIYGVGSTITLEAWDRKYKPNLDWNHAWGAAPANIIPRLLVGVEPIEPGFGLLRIKPQIGWLSSVKAEVPTIRGPVKISIEKDESRYRLHCTIPANTAAEVHLPASDPLHVSEGGHAASRSEGVRYVGMSQGRAVHSIQAGSYEFSVKQPNG